MMNVLRIALLVLFSLTIASTLIDLQVPDSEDKKFLVFKYDTYIFLQHAPDFRMKQRINGVLSLFISNTKGIFHEPRDDQPFTITLITGDVTRKVISKRNDNDIYYETITPIEKTTEIFEEDVQITENTETQFHVDIEHYDVSCYWAELDNAELIDRPKYPKYVTPNNKTYYISPFQELPEPYFVQSENYLNVNLLKLPENLELTIHKGANRSFPTLEIIGSSTVLLLIEFNPDCKISVKGRSFSFNGGRTEFTLSTNDISYLMFTYREMFLFSTNPEIIKIGSCDFGPPDAEEITVRFSIDQSTVGQEEFQVRFIGDFAIKRSSLPYTTTTTTIATTTTIKTITEENIHTDGFVTTDVAKAQSSTWIIVVVGIFVATLVLIAGIVFVVWFIQKKRKKTPTIVPSASSGAPGSSPIQSLAEVSGPKETLKTVSVQSMAAEKPSKISIAALPSKDLTSPVPKDTPQNDKNKKVEKIPVKNVKRVSKAQNIASPVVAISERNASDYRVAETEKPTTIEKTEENNEQSVTGKTEYSVVSIK